MGKVDYKHSKSKTDSDIRDLWQTPIELYEYLNARFNFVCDVAASDHNYLHLNYLTESYDSVLNGWSHLKSGYAFCNPPYSRILPWIKTAREAADHGVGTVMLLPVDTSVEWFNELRRLASEIYFIVNGRISFVRSDNKQKINGNNRGSLFAVFNPRGFGDCRVSFVDRDEIFKTYEKIKGNIPDPNINTVWPKEVNRIFDSIENAKYLKLEAQTKVRQSINKMIMDRLPPEQLNNAAKILVDRMEAKL
ncbi:phage N-6-adenine-methyltransferase [Gilliamella sp. B3486]|uniref:phage N-6-adenine-methyltransferase n=1 Tax=unclassified Gilliamella TaxID=2685620 RepID=UPI00226AA07E|nr:MULTISPECIES: phage N-6-adenine-methyltransferase [unclassified Gilliamella]MCX8596778.1 phage N-6-adenine-methyltransferase [Gilliamella sp. B3493]MCX8598507.1 phage N-6-adenine-methyltransferase [Gilliamella sp. B3486]MCX8704494.1 phage N-6-adenine-methyltransferase [Gilliamella sp. B3127]